MPPRIQSGRPEVPKWRSTLAGVEPFRPRFAFLTLAGTRAQRVFAMAAMLLVAFTCLAQDQPQSPAPPDFQSSSPPAAPTADAVTIPAGTRFALVLTNRLRAGPRTAEMRSTRKPSPPSSWE